MSEEELPAQTDDEREGYIEVLNAERELTESKVQLESLLNATDALESLVAHLNTHEVVSDSHKHALLVSFENLVGDSGLTVNDLMPSLEGHVLGTVSTESLKDRLQGLWKRLVAAVLAVLGFSKRFWTSIATYRGQLRMSAEAMVKKGAMRRGATVRTPTIHLGLEIKSFVVGTAIVKDPDSLIRSVSGALGQYKLFTDTYGKSMLTIGNQFEQMLTGETTGLAQLQQVSGLFNQMPNGRIAAQMKAMAYRDPRFGNRLTLAAPPVMGGWNLYFLSLKSEQQALADTDPLAYAAAVRTTGVRFAQFNVNSSNVNSGDVKTAGGHQVETLARRVLEILDTIDAQERSIGFGKIEAQIKNVLRAGDAYNQRTGSEVNSYDESVLRFVRNYAGWAMGPVDQMTVNLLTISRNLLTYGRKSLTTQ